MAVTIPENITVHLGSPGSDAENITLPFADYIKNVASHEIYPTWPEEAIRANILAQISYALNRIYTEWYPSMGYDYDITNDTRYDQSFKKEGEIFENISRITDEIFNDYIVNEGSILPYFTAYCDGRYTRCPGLEQWTTLELANQGNTAEEILKYFYGDDISIVYNAEVEDIEESYPGIPLRQGSAGNAVLSLQRQLNRISRNYPAIPRVGADGYFGVGTENAVKEFQRVFDLTPDGVVGKATWYKIRRIYNAVMNLAELYSDPITPEMAENLFLEDIRLGSSGNQAETVQYYLALVAYFDDDIPVSNIRGPFSEANVETVKAFQRKRGLEPTGIVDRNTWNELVRAYNAILLNTPPEIKEAGYEVYPGRVLTFGMRGDDVTALQNLIIRAREKDNTIPAVEVTGVFDDATNAAVRELQRRGGYRNTGAVGPVMWEYIVSLGA